MTYQITDLSNIFQKDIAPEIQEVTFLEKEWYNTLHKNSGITPLANNSWYMSVRKGRIPTVNTSDGGQLLSGKAQYDQMLVQSKFAYGTVDITHPALMSALGNKGSLINLATQTGKDLKNDMMRDLQRQFMGDGSAIIAQANGSGSSSTSLTVEGVSPINGDIDGDFYIDVGMNIKIGSGASVAVTAVNANVVTLAAARSWSDNDSVYKCDYSGTTADDMMGLKGGVGDGTNAGAATLQTIVRSTNAWMQSYTRNGNSGSNETLAVANMYNTYHRGVKYAKQSGNLELVLFNMSLEEKYGALNESKISAVKQTDKLMAGWSGLEFMGGKAECHLDFDCPDGSVFFITPKSITIAEQAGMAFLDNGGPSGIMMRRPDYASYQMVLYWYGNLFFKNPRANSVMIKQTKA